MSISQTLFLNEPKPKPNGQAIHQNDITAIPAKACDAYCDTFSSSEFKNKLASRLLILSCSQRKHAAPSLLPALERYDGPAYRVLRKFLRIYPQEANSLEIYILSAEFGLIAASDIIPNYDRRMNKQRASELRPNILAALRRILEDRRFIQFQISLGSDYFNALSGYEQFIPHYLSVVVSTGTPGRKLSILRNWLYGNTRLQLTHNSVNENIYKARLRGIEIKFTPDEVAQIARQALTEGRGKPDSYQSWYVEMNGQRVAPKWLVSVLTGVPVSKFATDEARRILAQLGVRCIPRG